MDLADTPERGGNRTGSYAFGGYVLDPLRRCVWRDDGSLLSLAPRAFSALQLFVEHPGELLYKEWLIARLWPGSVVDENSLSQIVSGLRRELGDHGRLYIQTEARRGFRFVCPVIPQPAMTRGAGQDERPRLAVLPFINLDQDSAQDYFVAGMMEEIVSALTRTRSLFVIASNTTKALTGAALVPEIAARRLGVHYIVEGSVRRAGSRIRITVKLTDGIDNAQIWSQRFEGTLEDVFELQDNVALGVAGVIEPRIRDVEFRRIAKVSQEHLNCYDLYLRAAHLRTRLNKDTVFESLALLERALKLDPEFAPALAQAAGCHSQIFAYGWSNDPAHNHRQGHSMVERALQTCGDDAGVLAQLANALMDLEPEPGSNIDRALELITRARTLNPGSAFAWFISGVLHLIDGNGKVATEHLTQAMRLDPVSPLHGVARSHLGLGLFAEGRLDEALTLLRAATNRTARTQLSLACLSSELGQLTEAREELKRFEQMSEIPAEVMVPRMVRAPTLKHRLATALSRIRSAG